MLLLGTGVDSVACFDKPSIFLHTLLLLVGLANTSIDLYSMMFLGVSTVSRRSWHVRTSPMVLLAVWKSLCGIAIVGSLEGLAVAVSFSTTLAAVVKSKFTEVAVSELFADTEGDAKEPLSSKANDKGLLDSVGSSGKEVGDFLPLGGIEGNITALVLIRLQGKASLGLVFAVSSRRLSVSPVQVVLIEVERE